MARDFLLVLALLAGGTALFAVTGLDLTLERLFYLKGSGWVLGDLNPWLRRRASAKRGTLTYGNLARIDVSHARHLADLPRVIAKEVPHTWHNTIVTLLADGTFGGILRRFLR